MGHGSHSVSDLLIHSLWWLEMMDLIQRYPLLIKGKKPDTWLGKSRPLLPEDFEQISTESLTAMRLAQSQPIPVDADQEAQFHAMRGTAGIAVYKTERKLRGRAKKLRYRRAGKGGAYLPVSPVEWDQAQARAAFRIRLHQTFKKPPPSEAGVSARQTLAQARATRVLVLLPRYQARGRDCAALIARQLDEPIAYVRRILREERTRRAPPIF